MLTSTLPPTTAAVSVDDKLNGQESAAFVGISYAVFKRAQESRKVPRPIPSVGRRVYFRRSELALWKSLGMPTTDEFDKILAARRETDSLPDRPYAELVACGQ